MDDRVLPWYLRWSVSSAQHYPCALLFLKNFEFCHGTKWETWNKSAAKTQDAAPVCIFCLLNQNCAKCSLAATPSSTYHRTILFLQPFCTDFVTSGLLLKDVGSSLSKVVLWCHTTHFSLKILFYLSFVLSIGCNNKSTAVCLCPLDMQCRLCMQQMYQTNVAVWIPWCWRWQLGTRARINWTKRSHHGWFWTQSFLGGDMWFLCLAERSHCCLDTKADTSKPSIKFDTIWI